MIFTKEALKIIENWKNEADSQEVKLTYWQEERLLNLIAKGLASSAAAGSMDSKYAEHALEICNSKG